MTFKLGTTWYGLRNFTVPNPWYVLLYVLYVLYVVQPAGRSIAFTSSRALTMSCAGIDTFLEKLSSSGLKDVIFVYTCQHQQWR